MSVSSKDVPGAQIQPIKEGEAISFQDAIDQTDDDEFEFVKSGVSGLDYVLGGGIPRSIAILLCAAPGAGKSTLLIEVLRSLAKQKLKTLYVNAEEKVKQMAIRYKRLGKFPQRMKIADASDLNEIFRIADEYRPDFMAIDSLQALEGISDPNGNEYSPGSASSVTQAAREIKKYAGEQEVTIFAVGHVNKDGTIAGTNTVIHMLDGTLYLHAGTNEQDPHRVLECQGKYRFGERGRRAMFKMAETGMLDMKKGMKSALNSSDSEPFDLEPKQSAGKRPN